MPPAPPKPSARPRPWCDAVFAVVALTTGPLLLATASASPVPAQPPGRNMLLLAHWNEFPTPPAGIGNAYSACWSYVHPDGREYALLGTARGTAIYNVTNPLASYRVAFIPGPPSSYREMKSYRTWVYIVTEATTAGRGVQIVRMTDPEHPTLVRTYTTGFIRSHTVSVDPARGLLFCNGTWSATSQTGMRILSLADPENPVEIGRWPMGPPFPDSDYVHDSVPFGNRVFASSIGAGLERVLDLTDPTQPVEITRWTYPGAHTHNAWPDASGRWLYVTDEVNGQPLKVFDIADIQDPRLISGFTPNPQAIVHNAHVRGAELYLSSYTEGIRICDLSDPAHPAEFAWSDTYPGPSGGFAGVWEVCPYFPSGLVIGSDMQTGLYLYWPSRNYGLLRVEVQDAGASGPAVAHEMAETPFMVHLTTQGDSLAAGGDGVVRFAPSQGHHEVTVRKFGYFDGMAAADVEVGQSATVRVVMTPRPGSRLIGSVRTVTIDTPIADAEVSVAGMPLHTHADSLGDFEFDYVPLGVHTFEVHAPGYRPRAFEHAVGPNAAPLPIALAPAVYWDNLESESGWTVGSPGDDASAGWWERAVPASTPAPTPGRSMLRGPGEVTPDHLEDAVTDLPTPTQPGNDRTPGRGRSCFLTGLGPDDPPDADDLDGGITTLTSPRLDLVGLARPTIGCWVWFYSFYPVTGHPTADDWMAVLLSRDDGASWVTADTLRGLHNDWSELTIPVDQLVGPTPAVRLRFVAADRGLPSLVEAAVDDLILYDDAAPVAAVGGGPMPPLGLSAWPQPSSGSATLALSAPTPGPIEIAIFDALGRRVRSGEVRAAAAGPLTWRWDGRDAGGASVPAGLYFARARGAGGEAWLKLVRLR